MKRLGRNETEVLLIVTAGYGDRPMWSARKVCQAAAEGTALNPFTAERALDRLTDRGLMEREEWAFGSGPRAYAVTARGETAAANIREARRTLVAA